MPPVWTVETGACRSSAISRAIITSPAVSSLGAAITGCRHPPPAACPDRGSPGPRGLAKESTRADTAIGRMSSSRVWRRGAYVVRHTDIIDDAMTDDQNKGAPPSGSPQPPSVDLPLQEKLGKNWAFVPARPADPSQVLDPAAGMPAPEPQAAQPAPPPPPPPSDSAE